MTSCSDFSSWYTSIAQSCPLLLMQHSHLTLAFKPILFPHTLYLLPQHRLMLLDVSLYLRFLFPNLIPSGFFYRMLGVSESGTLNCYTVFRLIPLTLIVSRNPTLIHLLLSGFLDSLLCDGTHSRSGIFFD